MREINVLITAASRRVPLIQAFGQALKRLDLRGNVITTDLSNMSPGLYFGSRHYLLQKGFVALAVGGHQQEGPRQIPKEAGEQEGSRGRSKTLQKNLAGFPGKSC